MIINLTPHNLVLQLGDVTKTIASSGVARCQQSGSYAGKIDDVPLVTMAYGAVEGLPEPIEGTVFVVSALVRCAVPMRSDVASPGDLVRDSLGAVVGCRNLVIN